MKELHDNLPTTVSEAVKDGHPMSMVEKVTGELSITRFIEYELIQAQSMLNMNPTLLLQKHQLPIVAKELYQAYIHESVEDLAIAFRRGAMGFYNPEGLFRVDGAVINGWIRKYLEEKYAQIEQNLAREKSTIERNEKGEIEGVNYDAYKNRRKQEEETQLTDRQKYAQKQREDAQFQMTRMANPRKKYNVDGFVVMAVNEEEARKAYRATFKKEPQKVTLFGDRNESV